MNTYIFDFDGTLVDSMPFWGRKMLNILDSQKIDYPDDILITLATLGDLGSAEYMKKMGVKLSIQEMLDMMDSYGLVQYRENIPAKPTVIETLKSLKEKGSSLNVLTASPHKMLDPCLKRLQMFDLFDNVWSTDDWGMPKTDTGIYKAVAEKLNTKPHNCVFFDDNFTALKTAKAAGMKVVGVYDSSSDMFTDEIKALSDLYITEFRELLNSISHLSV